MNKITILETISKHELCVLTTNNLQPFFLSPENASKCFFPGV